MDYTKQEEREKIYKERLSLDEFEQDALGKLNARLIFKIAQTAVAVQAGRSERYTLDIFNNAYYITTLILNTKRPELNLGSFMKISRTGSWDENEKKHSLREHFGALTMGMVSLYMYLCKPEQWEQDNCVLRTQMEERYKAELEIERYEQIMGTFYGDYFFMMQKRDETVADWFVSGKPLISPEVACSVFMPLPEASTSGCAASDSGREVLLSAKVEELQKRIAELEELNQPIEGLSAKQKVRMELGYLLLEKAGLVKKHGNGKKAAQVLSLLTGIESHNNKRGDEAHTCAQHIATRELPYERHKDVIVKINQLLTDLGIDIQITGTSDQKKCH